MKNLFLLFTAAILFAACSSPKYSYNFDYYNYNSGKKQATNPTTASIEKPAEASPLLINEQAMVASADASEVPVVQNQSAPVIDKQAVIAKISAMSKAERNQLKKDLKTELKKYKKAVKYGDNGASVKATKVMDQDLKLAAIFGAVGLVLTLFGGVSSVFWVLGVIAFVIGVVFLIKWLARQ